MTDTICALATAPGRAAIAVVRISGPGSAAALAALGVRHPKRRVASLRRLRSSDGEVLDRALTLWFPAPGSYTGEDSAELHLHGGAGVVDGVIGALLKLGLRLAKPGEFTRRAFENGRLRLDQAEAVGDLVEAESAAQARQAMGQLEGALGRRYHFWRSLLVQVLGALEAAVDFPDEDIPADVGRQALAPLDRVIGDLDVALTDSLRGDRVRSGYRVAIVGAPNAGKSTLINLMSGRDTAIVAAAPGTTRDVLEATISVAGYRLLIADTAGLRETSDLVEAEGVRRARAVALAADLRLWVIDRSSQDGSWSQSADLVRSRDLALINKSDLDAGADGLAAERVAAQRGLDVWVGSLSLGLNDAFWGWLRERVVRDLAGSDFPATTRARHVEHLNRARDHLFRARLVLGEAELASEDVRMALRELAMVTGEIGIEDILEEVFGKFCIGK